MSLEQSVWFKPHLSFKVWCICTSLQTKRKKKGSLAKSLSLESGVGGWYVILWTLPSHLSCKDVSLFFCHSSSQIQVIHVDLSMQSDFPCPFHWGDHVCLQNSIKSSLFVSFFKATYPMLGLMHWSTSIPSIEDQFIHFCSWSSPHWYHDAGYMSFSP